MKQKGSPPEKGSSQWKKNESIIAKNPFLRSVRDKSEGFTSSSTSTGGWTPSQAYKDNYDAIFGKKDKTNDQT